MNNQKNIALQTGLVFSACLLAVSLTAILLASHYERIYFQSMGRFCRKIIENQPEMETSVLAALKESQHQGTVPADADILFSYGYCPDGFLKTANRKCAMVVAFSGAAGGMLFLSTLLLWRKKDRARLKELTEALEKVNTEGSGLLLQTGEDDFSKLQDEIYKTVTMLYQTRDAALKAKNNFAENLSNIAHQIKTPITAISLSAQMLERHGSPGHLEQIQQQLARLAHLEESLLLLSRVDAGTLSFERKAADVFTLLMLAADHLQELFFRKNVSVEIPELGEITVSVDLDWTMEAVANLFKNCMEHTPSGGTVYCHYEQNPLYTQIRIWDTGTGFEKEDIPHLFERFYRGKNEKNGGIGIGLSLAKAIIEKQNGTIHAGNLEDGGACFEIRFFV